MNKEILEKILNDVKEIESYITMQIEIAKDEDEYNIKPLKLISEDEPINKIEEINKNREKINELVLNINAMWRELAKQEDYLYTLKGDTDEHGNN